MKTFNIVTDDLKEMNPEVMDLVRVMKEGPVNTKYDVSFSYRGEEPVEFTVQTSNGANAVISKDVTEDFELFFLSYLTNHYMSLMRDNHYKEQNLEIKPLDSKWDKVPLRIIRYTILNGADLEAQQEFLKIIFDPKALKAKTPALLVVDGQPGAFCLTVDMVVDEAKKRTGVTLNSYYPPQGYELLDPMMITDIHAAIRRTLFNIISSTKMEDLKPETDEIAH